MHIELLDALGANLDHLTSLVADGAAALDMPQELDMPMSELKEKAFELDSLGSDVLIFLAASTFVVPLSRLAGISPVLGFLAIGCAIGPYGLQLFSDSQADVELGDFGILFLLQLLKILLSSALDKVMFSHVCQSLHSAGACAHASVCAGACEVCVLDSQRTDRQLNSQALIRQPSHFLRR